MNMIEGKSEGLGGCSSVVQCQEQGKRRERDTERETKSRREKERGAMWNKRPAVAMDETARAGQVKNRQTIASAMLSVCLSVSLPP